MSAMSLSAMHRRLTTFVITLAWGLALPMSTLAAPAPVTVSVTPFPNNAAAPLLDFVTAGELVAFDLSLSNGGSTTTGVTFSGSAATAAPGAQSATYEGTLVTGGSAAGQAVCSDPEVSAVFSCSVGNLAGGATLHLRVIYRTPAMTPQTLPAVLTFSVAGTGNGAALPDGGNSRGDTFSGSAQVELVPLFRNGLTERGAAEYVQATGGAVIETASPITGADNPAWTKVTLHDFGAAAPFGTYGFLKEHDAGTAFPCPVSFCFGQASELDIFGGDPLPEPMMVELRLDNAKASVATPKKVTIYHVLDDGSYEKPFDTPCSFDEETGLPTVLPCGVSRTAASDDKNDYVFVFWLDENGYTRGG